ncbi:MAG TPA: Gfo/Idh/MocA family oxidoreductase [Lachnospiraceae bacterium]|nr:Gfo/Idh/MocA family oxidoreductase [Lachnospiraceae bacterium]
MMNLGIAGAGLIVHHFLSFIHEVSGIRLQAIYARDNKEQRLTKLCMENQINSFYTDYEKMLSDKQIDTVYVAVSNHMHYIFVKKALLSGKHVICEKPFTVTLSEFDELCRIAREKKLFLLEAITTLYFPNYLAIKEAVKTIGDIRIITCNFSQYSSRYDDFKKGIIKPCFDPAMAGGALMDLNVYNIHFVVNLFGEPKTVRYYPNIRQGVDVSGILILSYETFQCVLIGAKDCGAPPCTNIQGDKGCIYMESPANTCARFEVILNNQKPDKKELNKDFHRMYYEFAAFERMLKEGDMETAATMLEQSRCVMKVLEQAKAGMII